MGRPRICNLFLTGNLSGSWPPETVRLPMLPIIEDELVARKGETGNTLWRVKSVNRGMASLEKAHDRYAREPEKH
jgi:hypothetical protein